MANNRRCVFCGNTDLSNEHIFAQWLLKELKIIKNDVRMSWMSVSGIELSHRQHPYSKLVNGKVCKTCNGGWMSQLETSCQEHLIRLMDLENENFKNEVSHLPEFYKTIAKWAFKNAILLNSASDYRDVVPDSHFKALYSGTIPAGVFIDMSFCTEDDNITWRQSDSLLVFMPSGTYDRIRVIKSPKYRISFQIKNLLFKVVYFEHNNHIDYSEPTDTLAFRIYPNYEILFQDPQRIKMYKNIDDFDCSGAFYLS